MLGNNTHITHTLLFTYPPFPTCTHIHHDNLLTFSFLTFSSHILSLFSTISYMLRPNEAALKALEKVRTLPIGGDEHPNACVTMYVRHGDKHSEMKLVRKTITTTTTTCSVS